MRLENSVVTWMVDAKSSMDVTIAPPTKYMAYVGSSTLRTAHESW